MRIEERKTWKNDAGNQKAEPLRIYYPEALNHIVAIIASAEHEGLTVKAVGGHHSFSDVAISNDYIVNTYKLNSALPLDDHLFHNGATTDRLVRTEAGVRIRDLNDRLWSAGLALPNMGGYDAQTIIGAIATSTHGSGMSLGPISDAVRAIEIIARGGQFFRIEPANGLTDPVKYANHYPNRTLKQDDDWFQSVVVSMGCMGVIYALTLEVDDRYWLRENRLMSTWTDVKAALRQGDVLRDFRHWEFLINPYKDNSINDNRCLITRRNKLTTEPAHLSSSSRHRNAVAELAASIPGLQQLLNAATDLRPQLTPGLLDAALSQLVDAEYVNKSFKVFNIGAANELPVVSSEIALPIDGRENHFKAIDKIIEIVEERRRIGKAFHTAPIAARFVKASEAYLSMMHGRDTMMIELILLDDTEGGKAMHSAYEEALYKLGGRPHWGQINTMTGSHNMIQNMYPEYPKWKAVYDVLNSRGTFDSPFTKRVGISESSYTP